MNSKKKNTALILVDGSSYLYRAFHAMPGLSNSGGEPTGAVYGVTNMLRKLLTDYDPQYIAVVFDAKGKTFRNDLYPEYKANRPPMPEELRPQVALVHEIVEAMGLNLMVIEGVEADDVIGTLATQAADDGREAIISSGDKDLTQLVNQHVSMVDTMKGVVYDHDGVVAKFGVPPEKLLTTSRLLVIPQTIFRVCPRWGRRLRLNGWSNTARWTTSLPTPTRSRVRWEKTCAIHWTRYHFQKNS